MLKLKYAEHGLQNLPKRVDSIVVWRSYKQKQPLKNIIITKAGILKEEGHLGPDLLMSAAASLLSTSKTLLKLIKRNSVCFVTDSF